MHDVGRRIEALATPIAAAFGCEVVEVRFSQGRHRAIVTVFLDLALLPPGAEDWVRAATPYDAGARGEPPPYAGSRVSVDTCGRASREIEAAIDAEGAIVGSYVLEVSSPGLDRSLVRPADFVRHHGRTIEVRTATPLAGSRHVRGRLAAVAEDGFVVVPSGGGGGSGAEPRRIGFGDVVSARLVIELKQPVKPGHSGNKVRKR